jgi:hypothetical protein
MLNNSTPDNITNFVCECKLDDANYHKDVAQTVDTLLMGEAPTPSLTSVAVAGNNTSDEDVEYDDSPAGNAGREHERAQGSFKPSLLSTSTIEAASFIRNGVAYILCFDGGGR